MKRGHFVGTLAALAVTLALLQGCQMFGGGSGGGIDPDEPLTLKVLYSNEGLFRSGYGQGFSVKYPNARIEVIPTATIYGPDKDPVEELLKLIDSEKPDVLTLNAAQFKLMVETGRLRELHTLIERDRFDIENMHPPVIDYLTALGAGTLYGLSPFFLNDVLYYNIDLFDQYGVEYPVDYMSWDEVMQLAMRFPAVGEEERIYGFYDHSAGDRLYHMIFNKMGASLGLSWIDYTNHKLMLQTESWFHVFERAVSFYSSGRVGVREPLSGEASQEEQLRQNLFNVGKSAMMIGSYVNIDELARAREVLDDAAPFEWGVVTAPVDPDNRMFTSGFAVPNVFAVHAEAADVDAAWELVKYINGDDAARRDAASTRTLLTRQNRMKEAGDPILDPFYAVAPDVSAVQTDESLPGGFYAAFIAVFNEEMQAVMEQGKPLETALADLERRGQAELDLATQAAGE